MNFNEFKIQMLIMGFVLKRDFRGRLRTGSHIYEYELPNAPIFIRVRIDTNLNTIMIGNIINKGKATLISNRGNLLGLIKETVMELD